MAERIELKLCMIQPEKCENSLADLSQSVEEDTRQPARVRNYAITQHDDTQGFNFGVLSQRSTDFR